MNENTTDAHRRARTAPRIVVLACAIGLAAAAGVIAARAVVPHDGRASLPASDRLIERTGQVPTSFADIVDAVKPAVIGVQTKLTENTPGSPMNRFARPFDAPDIAPGAGRRARIVTAQGSGFFISPDGYAVTNHHVVETSATAEIQTDDQKTYTAKVVGTDPTSDLALLKVDGRNDFPYVKLADKMPRVGDRVLAVGNPFGLGGSVTSGIVSALERNIGGISSDNLIQIDAPINKGDSGGPTFDLDGQVIGVNMMIFSPSGGSVGIAFAIPAQTVRMVVPQLKEKGSVTRGWLGVHAQAVTPDLASGLDLKEAQGALVTEAQSDGPAGKAGITAGDVIVSVDGAPIKSPPELSRTIGAKAPGTSVKLGVVRQGGDKSIIAVLGQLPEHRPSIAAARREQDSADQETAARAEKPNLGLEFAPPGTMRGAGAQGVLITGIDPTGPAADHGLERGDVILEVSGRSVTTPDEIRSALGDARRIGKRMVMMRLRSGDTIRFVALPTG